MCVCVCVLILQVKHVLHYAVIAVCMNIQSTEPNDVSPYARQKDMKAHIILPGTCIEVLTPTCTSTYRQFIICMSYLSKFHYQARFCLQISYPAISITVLIGFLNCGSFIVYTLLSWTSKVFTLSVFLPGTHVHVVLLGTQLCILPYYGKRKQVTNHPNLKKWCS